MRRTVTAALLGVWTFLLLAGCATMAERVGIASSESVDQKLTATRSELEQEIAALRAELETQQRRVSQIEDLSVDLEQAIQATQELEQLAGIMESRLERMPRDTIEELVAILQRYLEGGE
jgi:outer membrane murein-binding lipoprotein Lpp